MRLLTSNGHLLICLFFWGFFFPGRFLSRPSPCWYGKYWLHLRQSHDIVICFPTSVCRAWFTLSNFPSWTSFKGLAVLKWLLSAIPGWCTHIPYNRSHQTASMWAGMRVAPILSRAGIHDDAQDATMYVRSPIPDFTILFIRESLNL